MKENVEIELKGSKKIIRYLGDDGRVVRVRVQEINEDPCMAKQQFRDQQDINLVMRKYNKKAQDEYLASANFQGVYADLTGLDFEGQMNRLAKAQSAFDGLSSDLRTRFNNNPALMLKFLDDPKNVEEGIKLGLLQKREAPKPSDTDRVVDSIKDLAKVFVPSKKEPKE